MLYRIARVFFRFLFYTIYRLKVYGLENIPAQGAVIMCSNHISLWDPPLIGTPLERRIHFMAKEELFKIPILKQIIVHFGAFPVKRGGVSKQSIRQSLKLLSEGKLLGIFPEGTRKNTGGPAQRGAASLALRSKATVIPVAIIGQYKWFRQMKIVFGPPVDLSSFSEEMTTQVLEQATSKIMEAIEDLKRKYS